MKISEASEIWESTIWPNTEPDEFEGQIYLLLINVLLMEGFSHGTYGSPTLATILYTILLCATENSAFRRVGMGKLESTKVMDWESYDINPSTRHARLSLPEFITPVFRKRPKISIR
jgi:hypothetical protein